MPEGISATVTYSFDENYRVKETLYAWDSDNRSLDHVLKPIVQWAQVNDSTTINNIYLKDGFVPNTENAKKWKKLLSAYIIALENDK